MCALGDISVCIREQYPYLPPRDGSHIQPTLQVLGALLKNQLSIKSQEVQFTLISHVSNSYRTCIYTQRTLYGQTQQGQRLLTGQLLCDTRMFSIFLAFVNFYW